MKIGRPTKAEGKRGDALQITFRIDTETLVALKELESLLPKGVKGKRSAILRGLILNAAIEKRL